MLEVEGIKAKKYVKIESLIESTKYYFDKTNSLYLEYLFSSPNLIRLVKSNYCKIVLYALRTYLYTIINKYIKEIRIRETVKKEVLRVPIGTFTEFLSLFDELKQEERLLSDWTNMYDE